MVSEDLSRSIPSISYEKTSSKDEAITTTANFRLDWKKKEMTKKLLLSLLVIDKPTPDPYLLKRLSACFNLIRD